MIASELLAAKVPLLCKNYVLVHLKRKPVTNWTKLMNNRRWGSIFALAGWDALVVLTWNTLPQLKQISSPWAWWHNWNTVLTLTIFLLPTNKALRQPIKTVVALLPYLIIKTTSLRWDSATGVEMLFFFHLVGSMLTRRVLPCLVTNKAKQTMMLNWFATWNGVSQVNRQAVISSPGVSYCCLMTRSLSKDMQHHEPQHSFPGTTPCQSADQSSWQVCYGIMGCILMSP